MPLRGDVQATSESIYDEGIPAGSANGKRDDDDDDSDDMAQRSCSKMLLSCIPGLNGAHPHIINGAHPQIIWGASPH